MCEAASLFLIIFDMPSLLLKAKVINDAASDRRLIYSSYYFQRSFPNSLYKNSRLVFRNEIVVFLNFKVYW